MIVYELNELQDAQLSKKILDFLKFVWNPVVLCKTDFVEKCTKIYVKEIIQLSIQDRSDLVLKYLQELSEDVYEDQAAYLRCENVCSLILNWYKNFVPSRRIGFNSNSETEKFQNIFNNFCYQINKIPCRVDKIFKHFLPYVKFENNEYYLIYSTDNLNTDQNRKSQSIDEMLSWYTVAIQHYLENAPWMNAKSENDLGDVKISISPQFMYCQNLNYQDKFGEFSMTVEQSPDGGILVWTLDIPRSDVQRKIIKQIIVQKLSYTKVILIESHRV